MRELYNRYIERIIDVLQADYHLVNKEAVSLCSSQEELITNFYKSRTSYIEVAHILVGKQ